MCMVKCNFSEATEYSDIKEILAIPVLSFLSGNAIYFL